MVKLALAACALWLTLHPPSAAASEPAAGDAGTARVLVDVIAHIPDAVLDLRYATEANFLGRKVYPDDARCLLRPEAVQKLKAAAERLRAQGFRLRLYDCYRPRSVQWEMWKILPKPGYVADPAKGSHHNRGAAVDLGLTLPDGTEAQMPTPFDTFSRAAHHGYDGAGAVAIRHRELLREAMEAAGFRKNRMEWWHYSLPGAGRLPILEEPLSPPSQQ
jgi:zinc D-Ala-D-Ala dipeptidase